MPQFEPVIGLEIHAQLLTATKIFCGCPTRFGAEPNTALCPVCLGLPGALPVLNRRAVELAAAAALALGCEVQPESIFARKNYFYPDLPKGYQISQYDRPLATDGSLAFRGAGGDVTIGIVRVHMEEDAGKSLHDGFPDRDRTTHLDFNRSGVPLIEIVTRPDLRSAADAAEAFSRVREILVAIGVNDGNMEEGSLRCDANVSVREQGDTAFGVKTELKNLNSFRHVQRAVEFEIDRHIDARRSGTPLRQETRLWDPGAGRTIVMRTKEEADDYRYFPEPDLPPLMLDAAWIEEIRRTLPELPEARRRRFVSEYRIPEYDAGVLTQSMELADYFERVAKACGNPKSASNWVMGEVTRKLKETRSEPRTQNPTPTPNPNPNLEPRTQNPEPETPNPNPNPNLEPRTQNPEPEISADALAELIRLVDGGTITGPVAKDVFEKMYGSGQRAKEIVEREGLARIDDAGAIDGMVRDVLAGHAATVAEYRAGKTKTFGFLVGQVMKAAAGKADPAKVNESVRKYLEQ